MKVKRKTLVRLLVLLIFVTSINLPVEAAGQRDIKVWVNGSYLMSDVDPYLHKSRTYVPIRFIGEELGYDVGWDSKTQAVTIKSEDTELVFKIGSKIVLVNGEIEELEMPAVLKNSRTFVPFRNIGELLGQKIGYHTDYRVAIIGKDFKASQPYPINYYHKNREPIKSDIRVNFAGYKLEKADGKTLNYKDEPSLKKAIKAEMKKYIGPEASDKIIIKDRVLEQVVREIIKKPKGDILRSDVEKVKKIHVPYPQEIPVRSIDGLENFINLEYFDAFRLDIENIEALRNLKKLKYLNFSDNRIRDIGPLAELTELEHLELDRNRIVNLEPLRNLKKLRHLDLNFNNDVKDRSPIKHLEHLEPFFIQDNLNKR